MRFFEELLKLDSDWRTSEYSSVERWIRRLRRRGSVSTSMAYFKLLAWFVKFTWLSPDAFIKLPKDDVASKVQSFCDRFFTPFEVVIHFMAYYIEKAASASIVCEERTKVDRILRK